jgi:uncharacterized protein (TIGR03086 family)
MADPTDVFRLTTAAVEPIVDRSPDPAAETPCAPWTYGQLLGHLVGGDRMVVGILSGRSRPPAQLRLAPEPDQMPPTPREYREWNGRLAHLLAEPQVQTGAYDLPVGRLPGPQLVLLRSVEHLLHGWDLAKSAGVSTTTLERVAEALLEPAQRLLAAVGERTLADRRPFAPPVEVDDEASALIRLVAAFGRDPEWLPDPAAGQARLIERFAGHADVNLPDGTGRGFGAEGLRIGGSVFATPHQGRLMIKLPAEEVDRLIATGLGLPLSKPGQRPMREWVLVPYDGAAEERAEQAYAFVRGKV